MQDIQTLLNEIHAEYSKLNTGTVANYIPELAAADPNWFGMAVVMADGTIYKVGDVDQTFTIQSVSKPFTYGMVLEEHGRENVLKKVGVEPSGRSFNSLEIDETTQRPYNPMINAGAIVVAGMINGNDPTERLKRIMATMERYAGRAIHMDAPTFLSERATGHHNRAIAHLMKKYDLVGDDLEATLDLYFQQCSLLVNVVDLATMAATLANHGVNPCTQVRAIAQEYVRDVLSMMYTCGMYDAAGEWAYRVGLPGKSGVSGGIFAVVPGQMGIAAFSPLVNEKGNSVRALRTCERLSEALKLHIFEFGNYV